MKRLLFYYCLILALLLSAGAAASFSSNSIPFVFFLPVAVRLVSSFFTQFEIFKRIRLPFQNLLGGFFIYYSFVVVSVMTLAGIFGAETLAQLVSVIFFLPLALYFTLEVMPVKKRYSYITVPVSLSPSPVNEPVTESTFEFDPTETPTEKIIGNLSMKKKSVKLDVDRRQFLKLIGAAGLGVFIFSIFGRRRAGDTFFGALPIPGVSNKTTPSPGVVTIKDKSGAAIDPAEKLPHEGYSISQIDDAENINYYGFVNKDGDWYILRVDDGEFKYYKKQLLNGNFSAEWPHRASFNYQYFDYYF